MWSMAPLLGLPPGFGEGIDRFRNNTPSLDSGGSGEMDSFLINYLKSGRAWILIGSGPSIAMGYPSWRQLASIALSAAKVEAPGQDFRALDRAMNWNDYP